MSSHEQAAVVKRVADVAAKCEERLRDVEREKEEEETAAFCFRRIDRRIRSVLQHNKHLPTVSG